MMIPDLFPRMRAPFQAPSPAVAAARPRPVHPLALVGLALGGLLLAGCSAVTNVVSGLSTPQSTISGSTYVYSAAETNKTHRLTLDYNSALAGENINAGDSFVIQLDTGFIKYLQGVDPYVVVYSDCWMGSGASPTKEADRHRQIVLIKEGLGHNARLPISHVPLLGPVTLGSDYLPVTVTIKVVVLSKHSNEETIKLLESVAGAVGAAQPQYTVAAGAAASIGEAIVSLNRDKMEFEHRLTFVPSREPILSDTPETLRTGKLVILKGENRYRLVPFQTWYYYAWPFNWFGQPTAANSRRFENEVEHPSLRNPDSYLWFVTRAPQYLLRWLFVPSNWGEGKATDPTALSLTHQSDLIRDPIDGNTNEVRRQFYSEKSFMVVEIRRTSGSHGTFGQLRDAFSSQADALNGLLTSSDDARTRSAKAIEDAFDSVKKAAVYERQRRKLKLDADEGRIITSTNALADLPASFEEGERRTLIDGYVRDAENAAIKQFVNAGRLKYAELLRLGAAMGARTNQAGDAPNTARNGTNQAAIDYKEVWLAVITRMQEARWKPVAESSTSLGRSCNEAWQRGWETVRRQVRTTVSMFHPEVAQAFEGVKPKWEATKWSDQQVSELPAGYLRPGGFLVAWETPLEDLPWLDVVAEAGEQKTAAPGSVPAETPVKDLPETYTLENGGLVAVRLRRVTELPEEDFPKSLGALSERYGELIDEKAPWKSATSLGGGVASTLIPSRLTACAGPTPTLCEQPDR